MKQDGSGVSLTEMANKVVRQMNQQKADAEREISELRTKVKEKEQQCAELQERVKEMEVNLEKVLSVNRNEAQEVSRLIQRIVELSSRVCQKSVLEVASEEAPDTVASQYYNVDALPGIFFENLAQLSHRLPGLQDSSSVSALGELDELSNLQDS